MNPEIPKWRRLLSYMQEVPLETHSSKYNPYLQISLIKNRFQLSTEKSIYSFDDLYLNFHRAFERIDLPPDGSDILVLGLGLASVPFMLEKQFDKRYQYTVVEIDEVIIDLASRYTISRMNSPVQIYNADASIFIQSDEQSYDLVIVDLFLEDVIPEYFASIEGNQQLQKCISSGGTILYNRLYRTAFDKEKTEDFYENIFRKVFEDGEYLDVGGNWILKNRQKKTTVSL